MNTQEEMRKEYYALYDKMANSNNVAFMRVFGQVQKEVMEWAIANKPDMAQEWIEKLSSIRWKNYLTQKEADKILANMDPRSPWSRDQWKSAMQQHGYELEEEPYYNRCAMFVTMSMIYSDSINTLTKFTQSGDVFELIHALAIDKLKDRDGVFSVRHYFSL